MRPNRWVLLLSFIIGLAGGWSYVAAIQDYRRTAEAFTSVEASVVNGSFIWLDSSYRSAEAEVSFTNASRADANIEHFTLRLYIDGQFAGAQYRPWVPLALPRGEQRIVTIPFGISAPDLSPQAQNAELSVTGEMRLTFSGVEQRLTIPLSERIEVVGESGS
jgi:hypothetical protein